AAAQEIFLLQVRDWFGRYTRLRQSRTTSERATPLAEAKVEKCQPETETQLLSVQLAQAAGKPEENLKHCARCCHAVQCSGQGTLARAATTAPVRERQILQDDC